MVLTSDAFAHQGGAALGRQRPNQTIDGFDLESLIQDDQAFLVFFRTPVKAHIVRPFFAVAGSVLKLFDDPLGLPLAQFLGLVLHFFQAPLPQNSKNKKPSRNAGGFKVEKGWLTNGNSFS